MLNKKSKAKPVTAYGIKFASKFELFTYQAISDCIPRENIAIHTAITLTDSISWKVDFMVYPSPAKPYIPLLLIEAKGFEFDDFKLKARMLEDLHPSLFDKLLVVYAGKLPAKRNYAICSTTQLKQLLSSYRIDETAQQKDNLIITENLLIIGVKS